MSRKHNTKHNRVRSSNRSGYKKRLDKRGLTRAPLMMSLSQLRKRAGLSEDPDNMHA